MLFYLLDFSSKKKFVLLLHAGNFLDAYEDDDDDECGLLLCSVLNVQWFLMVYNGDFFLKKSRIPMAQHLYNSSANLTIGYTLCIGIWFRIILHTEERAVISKENGCAFIQL